MTFKTIKLTDITDNTYVYISLDKIITLRANDRGSGTVIVLVGTSNITVKESIHIVIAVLEDRDTFAARILYDRYDKNK